MKKYIPVTLLSLLPFTALAASSLQTFLSNTLYFINGTVIPFLFGIAFLIFVINVIRYFVAGAGNQEAQEAAKNVAMYSVAAFVFLGTFWGIVNMLSESTGLEDCSQVLSDYTTRDYQLLVNPACQ